MANCVITYQAKRRMRPGIVVGDQIALPLSVTQFERTTQAKENEVETLSGRTVSSLYSLKDRYEVATGVIPPEIQPALDEFGYSVVSREVFSITHPDEGGRVMDVTLVGKVRRTRAGKNPLNQFRYTFTVEEIIL